MLRLKS